MSKYKLTYIIQTLDWGGAQTGMARLLSGLDPEVFDVTVVCFRIDNEEFRVELPSFVDIIELDTDKKYQINRLLPLINAISRSDVLVCSMYYSSLIGTVVGRLSGVPAIFRWQHSTHVKNRFRIPFHKLTGHLSSRILADCRASADFLVRDLGIPKEAVTVLTLAGIDVESFPSKEVTGDCPIKVGAIGRLQPQKNFQALVDIASSFENDEYEFYVVGEGPERDALERASENVGSVHFLGSLSHGEVQEFLDDIDIYVQPSNLEGLCITVLEAMASGLPVVASPVGGISRSVVDGETGVLVENHDIDRFEGAIRRLGEREVLREEMGRAGRKRISRQYSRESLASEFTDLVRETVPDSMADRLE